MDHRLIEGLMVAIAPVIRETLAAGIEKACAPLRETISGLETRLGAAEKTTLPDVERLISDAVAKMPPARDGKDADLVEVTAIVAAEVERAVAVLPKPQDGKSVDLEDIQGMIEDAMALVPAPRDGNDADPAMIRLMVAEEIAKIPPATNGKDADPELIVRMVTEAVAKLPPAEPGKDADPVEIASLVAAEVAKAIDALPKPADGKDAEPEVIARIVADEVAKLPPAEPGKSITVDDVMPALQEMVAALPKPADGKSVSLDEVRGLVSEVVEGAVKALPKPRDGVGLAGAVINRDGELVLTLSDGSTKELGIVVGRDADQGALLKFIESSIAALPKPKDGRDGLGFDDLTMVEDGDRAMVFRFARGEVVKEFRHALPVQLDRGVWKDGAYLKGDGVTWGGSFWIAQEDTADKPETSKAWRLAVKRGRDGKDGKTGPKGDTGPQGPSGVDRR